MIKRKPLYEQVADTIVNRIKSGKYQPGKRLPTEKEISEELGVSRNSVREAMKSLCTAGIVHSVAGRGTFLNKNVKTRMLNTHKNMNIDIDVDFKSITEILELRLIMDPECAALAAERATPDQLKVLGNLIKKLKQAINEGGDWEQAAFEFHNQIRKMCKNETIINVMNSLTKNLVSLRSELRTKKSPMIDNEAMWNEHAEIYNAIKKRQPKLAKKLFKQHLENALEFYLE